ncbi:hypothetical protein BDR03DRAFT_970174 [Suillus americanus]|nr:hypothetical protein BDR03DRAFT_970174 [Suillus americanus]
MALGISGAVICAIVTIVFHRGSRSFCTVTVILASSFKLSLIPLRKDSLLSVAGRDTVKARTSSVDTMSNLL